MKTVTKTNGLKSIRQGLRSGDMRRIEEMLFFKYSYSYIKKVLDPDDRRTNDEILMIAEELIKERSASTERIKKKFQKETA